jgi:hypothetical protein
MNTNKTLVANYPSLIINFADTQIEAWYRVSLSNNVFIMDMKPVDNVSIEDWDWICSRSKHYEQIEELVAFEINNNNTQ